MQKKMIVIGLLVLLFACSVIASIVILVKQYNERKEGNIYIVIEQCEVSNGIIVNDGLKTVLLDELFTDDLVYHEVISSTYGFNEVDIKDGIAKVIDSNCPHPFSANGCRHHSISNSRNDFFSMNTIICMQHGLIIKLEVRYES